MHGEISTQINVLPPFKYFCSTIGELPTSYLESMSYYETVVWLCNYLKETIIPTVNNTGNAVTELQNLYLQLQDYVNNYFDNLDVQQEINNKLDNMAENGTLTLLIKNYVDPIYTSYENRINQNINNLQNQVNSIANGSPKGVYSTVASLTSDDPDHDFIYLVTADGKWYYWNSTQWTAGGIYQSTGIEDGSIGPEKTNFYIVDNLFPLSNWISGKVYFANDGHLGTFNNGVCAYNSTHKSVTPDDEYIAYSYGHYQMKIHYWDNSDNYLSTQSITDNTITKFTIPADASYVTFSSYSEPLTNLPPKVYCNLFTTYMNTTNNRYARIKEDYFNTLDSKNIILYNNVKINENIYNKTNFSTYDLTINNNALYFTGTPTSSENTRYVGFYFRPINYNLNDVYQIKSNIGKQITLYPGNFVNGTVTTTNNFGNLDFSNSTTLSFTLNQNMINYLEQNENNAITIGFAILSTEDSINIYFEIGGSKGRTMQDFIDNYVYSKTLKAIVLGDSITALTGSRSWLTYFNQIQPINIIQNTAVNGAWLNDKVGTIYDGNPVFNGPDNNVNNVLGNQVQKILNNNYATPDIIMIAIGTNSGITCSEQDIYNSYYDSSGNLIPLNNVDRKTSAGAFRYCNETLRNKYPNATIFWCSPIQGFNSIRNLNSIIEWGKNLENLCKYSSVQFINTEDCGITGYTENNGQQGLYLVDGLHPNSNGAKYMGYYNATKVKEYCDSCDLLNQ